jgi:hypothetical protein
MLQAVNETKTVPHPAFKLFRPENPYVALGLAVNHLMTKPAFAALCALDAVDSMTRTGFLTFVAFLLIARGLPEGWAALSVPLILTGGMAGKYACGVLAERMDKRRPSHDYIYFN